MNANRLCWPTLLALGACLSAPASAHHSYAQFDRCRSVTIEGEIERVLWAQPHVVVTVSTDAGKIYRVEWLDMRRLGRAGVREGALARGERLRITGSVHRDPAVATMTLITAIERAADGWRWSRPAPLGGAQACERA